ncbi:LysM peptidoglycan-binding domain-containing protein [uncultured Shimia sp.]|uniref:LysM peptidoglycan-binding domain-containing protein n=1 Tax=uncultured Shimia sp. TaxID=573152 RepID=UPI0025FF74DB|nr:LysM peptidoglycan-binding domain-containing protein [uncultured Shimia sp.]
MSDKASIFSGNVAWVAGVVVAMGVSVFALVSTGVLDGSDQTADDATTAETSSPATANTTEPAAEIAAEPAPEKAVEPETAEAEAEADDTKEAGVQPADTAAAEVSNETTTPTIAPSFDVVRVDAEGNTVVAGAAAPGAMLGILLDGSEVAVAPVDTAGKFAAILAIEPSDAPRVLSLVERRDEGDVPSDATVIVAPVVAVAEAVVLPKVVSEDAVTKEAEAGVVQDDSAATDEVAKTASPESVDQSETANLSAEDEVSSAPQAAEIKPEKPVESSDLATPESEVAAVEPTPKPKAPAVIVSDSEGVRVVQPAAPQDTTPEVLAAISIDSISYTDTGAVMVSGRGTPSGFVHLYLDNALAASTQIDAAGLWATQLGDVSGGIYELRADEVDASAKVLSRIVTPFKRETPETVAQARAQAEIAAAEEATAKADAGVSGEVDGVAEPKVAEATEAPAAAQVDAAKAAKTPKVISEDKSPEVAAVTKDAVTEVETSKATVSDPTAVEATSAPDAEAVETSPAVEAETSAEAEQPPASEQASADAPATTDASALTKPTTTPEAQPETAQPPVRIVTVQPGATLWAIARDRYGEGQLYLQVFEANKDKIRDPNLIYPGQVFTVPEE